MSRGQTRRRPRRPAGCRTPARLRQGRRRRSPGAGKASRSPGSTGSRSGAALEIWAGGGEDTAHPGGLMATGAGLQPEADQGAPPDRNGVWQYLAEGALRASHLGPVGLELERHLVDLTEPARRPAWARVRQALSPAELPGGVGRFPWSRAANWSCQPGPPRTPPPRSTGCAATATSPTALSLRLGLLRSASAPTPPGRQAASTPVTAIPPWPSISRPPATPAKAQP